jgi:aminoglycoside phosphotransferase (APT) family kinase protein
MADPTITRETFQDFLEQAEPDRRATVADFRQITGGYSRLSAVADVRWGDGATERFVLRGDPLPGEGVFVSDRDAEWQLLEALYRSGHVPIPRPRWYDRTGGYFGTKCIIVEHFPGRSLQDVLSSADNTAQPAGLFVNTVADIHTTPLDDLPDVMDRPSSWDEYIHAVLDHYRQIDQEMSDSSPILHYVSARLSAQRPPAVPLTLVHGDCQPGNVLVSESGDPVVIDWEFARIGDPREDLGYYAQIPLPPNVYHDDPAAFLARYRERTGLSEEQVNPDTVSYFLVIGMARLMVQLLQALDAVARGESRGILATYLINAVSHLYNLFFDVCGWHREPRLGGALITRPTTEQILLDCCQVLSNDILDAVSDETTQARIVMMEKVLRNAAARSAHEIAWMLEEVASVESYGRAVSAATNADGLRTALDSLEKSPRNSLHLDDVAETYCRASDVFSLSLEAALDANQPELIRKGESLLEARLAHENDVVGRWDSTGGR